jgi:hypothetical protein
MFLTQLELHHLMKYVEKFKDVMPKISITLMYIENILL